MADPIDKSHFTPAAQASPDFAKLCEALGKSPRLIAMINQLPATKKIDVAAGGGMYSSDAGITIDSRWLPSGSDPKDIKALSVALGHELGHTLLPHGKPDWGPPNVTNPKNAAESGLTAEGVALENEYKVAKEMHVPMWSGAAIETKLDQIAGSKVSDDEKHKQMVKAAGDLYGAMPPSVAPKLSYKDYYQLSYAFGKNGINMNAPGFWDAVTTGPHGNTALTVKADGSWQMKSTIPALHIAIDTPPMPPIAEPGQTAGAPDASGGPPAAGDGEVAQVAAAAPGRTPTPEQDAWVLQNLGLDANSYAPPPSA